ncbi:MAG: hypothetical protein K6F22_05695 [Prevotella sp.]|nr:hypothetical protein [Prevotella sp.]
MVQFMVTLTYARGMSPYVLRDEAFEFSNGLRDTLDVYRDCFVRKVRNPRFVGDYNQSYKFVKERVVLDSIDYVEDSSLIHTKDLKFEVGKIGICYYKDYQHFIARLRLNLKRHFGYEGKLFVYACSEYGTKSLRPHFHLLFFVEKSIQASFKNAVVESWPYANLALFGRSVERSYRAASYVASYVNKPAGFPKFLKDNFDTKHSYSKGFGLGNTNFSLSKILQSFERGSLTYTTLKNRSGFNIVADVPFPAYVIHRFFPKFKGYTRIAPDALVENMQRIGQYKYDEFLNSAAPVYLSEDEFRKVNIRLHNAYRRYIENVPDGYDKTFIGYFMLHKQIWDCYNSTILKLHLLNEDIPLLEKYDNLDVVLHNGIRCDGIDKSKIRITNPNEFHSTGLLTYRFAQSYYDTIKHRSVSNAIYALQDDCYL